MLESKRQLSAALLITWASAMVCPEDLRTQAPPPCTSLAAASERELLAFGILRKAMDSWLQDLGDPTLEVFLQPANGEGESVTVVVEGDGGFDFHYMKLGAPLFQARDQAISSARHVSLALPASTAKALVDFTRQEIGRAGFATNQVYFSHKPTFDVVDRGSVDTRCIRLVSADDTLAYVAWTAVVGAAETLLNPGVAGGWSLRRATARINEIVAPPP